jgi:anti-sigma factor ChrR (cupin superfamily)
MDNSQNYCFCELAPLYALDLLSEEERVWVEQQVSDCPDLAEELASFQSAVTAIPYSVPTPPISENVKKRLFERLELDTPTNLVKPENNSVSPLAIRSQDLNWQPHAVPGVVVAIVHTDEVKREVVGFLKAEPGVHYPFHQHAANEEILMLEGDLVVGDKVYSAGDYIRSHPGSSHAPHTNGGCKFFFHTSMDDEYPSLLKL